jgi:hypothetical protein
MYPGGAGGGANVVGGGGGLGCECGDGGTGGCNAAIKLTPVVLSLAVEVIVLVKVSGGGGGGGAFERLFEVLREAAAAYVAGGGSFLMGLDSLGEKAGMGNFDASGED